MSADPKDIIKIVAKGTAGVAGEMSLRIVKGKLSRRQITDWIIFFEMAAVELRKLISNRSDGNDTDTADTGDKADKRPAETKR